MAELTIQQAFDLASEHHRAGRFHEAELLYRQVLVRQPAHASALHHLGLLAHQVGHNDVAVDLIRRSILIRADNPKACSNLGNALKGSGHFDEAIEAYRRAIALDSKFAEAHSNLGLALKDKGDLDEAVAALRHAVSIRSDLPETHYNLANILKDQGKADEAIVAYRQAIAFRPTYAEAYCNLGNALNTKGQFDDAIASYQQAIALNPDYAEAHYNLGVAQKSTGQSNAALAAFRRAIALNPGMPEAHNNLGVILKENGELDEAIAACHQAISLKPNYAIAHSNLVFALQYHPGYDSQSITQETRRWNSRHAEPLREFIQPHTNNRDPDRRLRIGYVSADFRDHVVGRNLLPLFLHHDRQEFEIICYAHVPNPDAVTDELRQNADGWRNIVPLSDEQTAQQIREDGIDILVDLALHSAGNRLLVFARKPAPVQVSYLGYCGSTGLSTMDYRFSDPHLDPSDSDLSCYTEKTVRLPRTYWCYQPSTTANPAPPPARTNGFVTFGCLNNFTKVSAAALDLWAGIMTEAPNSRIMLYAPAVGQRDVVTQRLERAGIANDRVHFVGQRPREQYMQGYSLFDIALDPFPFGGGITTCDALWMGVPVVSLSGQTAVGRGGRSILSNLGLTELVAFAPEEYVKLAIELSRDLPRLAELRRTLRPRMLASPLMDGAQFARDVEGAYRMMWRTWCETVSAAS